MQNEGKQRVGRGEGGGGRGSGEWGEGVGWEWSGGVRIVEGEEECMGRWVKIQMQVGWNDLE